VRERINFHPLLLLLFLVSSLAGYAQASHPTLQHNEQKVYHFPIDRSLLMREYRNNADMLDSLDSLLNDSVISPRIDSILITGAASPIAGSAYNDSLARERAAALKSYILWKHPGFDPSRIHCSSTGVDWEGFDALVNADSRLPARKQIKDLLSYKLPKDLLLERLQTAGGRAAFDYLMKNIYPQLQYVSVHVCLTDGTCIPEETSSPLRTIIERTAVDTIIRVIHDTIYLPVQTVILPEETAALQAREKQHFLLGVKSNLIYDLALLPNLSLELPLGNNWSVLAEGNWSWWNFGRPTAGYHRIQAAGLEIRRWFASPAKLTGHAVGIYALAGTYDIRPFPKNDNTLGWLSNRSYSCGLSYGYSFPIAPDFNLELGVAAGYIGGRYYDYRLHAGAEHTRWEWQAIHNRNYFGLTRLGVSLVYELRMKN
jgi:hypothetical protein